MSSPNLIAYFAAGAAAQLIEGMAFGVVVAGLLVAMGLPPMRVSASVHYAEMVTCAASGVSHIAAGNVRRRLVMTLVVPGLLGALVGVWLISHVPALWVKRCMGPYLMGVGTLLILRGRATRKSTDDNPHSPWSLGFVAALADTLGGGGWSAITVPTLLARGATPRLVVGSVHVTKCLVSTAASVLFIYRMGLPPLSAVASLIGGGLVAAPFGALFARCTPSYVMTFLAAAAVLGLGVIDLVSAYL